MPRERQALLVAMAMLVLVPGAAQAQDSGRVVMKDFDFSPMRLTVKAGATVTWTNQDDEPHTVVSADGAFRSHALDQDENFSVTFDKPGIYKYLCSIHPKMMAEIVVQ